jgi:hypothetical protein
MPSTVQIVQGQNNIKLTILVNAIEQLDFFIYDIKLSKL